MTTPNLNLKWLKSSLF